MRQNAGNGCHKRSHVFPGFKRNISKSPTMEKSKLFCSFSANVTGIKFYDGWRDLHSMMRVTFRREYDNIHDNNAIVVLTYDMYDNKELGHLERPVAAAIAPLHDLQLPGFRIVGYVQYCQTICMFGRPCILCRLYTVRV